MNGEGGRFTRLVRYIPALLLCAVVILYCVYHLIASFTGKPEIETAYLTTFSETVSMEGHILRYEELLVSPVAGTKVDLAEDGEKVASGAEVARIYTVFNTEAYEELKETQRRLSILKRARITYSSLKNVPEVKAGIDAAIIKYNAAVAENDLDAAMLLRDEILAGAAQYQALTTGYDSFSEIISALEMQLLALERGLGVFAAVLTAPESGCYYRATDGYEQIFSAKKVDSLTLDSYRQLTETNADEYLFDGRTAGKLVTDFRWFVACETDTATAEKMKANQTYDVYFSNSDRTVSMTLYRTVTSRGENAVLLIFSCNTVPENFDYTRSQRIEVTAVSHTGYTVPVEAVRSVDGKTGVYILDRYVVRFRQISILYEQNGVYLSDPQTDPSEYLDLYDSVILNGTDLYDGKLID